MKHTGSKYEAGRSLKEIAKLVRRDIKAAKKAGELPNDKDFKVSVRTSYYSMGCSLNLSITKVPNPSETTRSQVRGWAETVLSIGKAYQRSEVDAMVDYFNWNFALSQCSINWELEKELIDDRPKCIDCDSTNVYAPSNYDELKADGVEVALRCPFCESQERDRSRAKAEARIESLCGLFAALAALPPLSGAEARFRLLELDRRESASEAPEAVTVEESLAARPLDLDLPEAAPSAHDSYLAALGVE